MSFVYQATTPPQLASATLGTDTSTSSSTYSNLLTTTFNVDAALSAQIDTTATVSTTVAALVSFQVAVDGTPVGSARDLTVALGATVSLPISVPSQSLAAGSHTIQLQWRTALGTARCRPQTANEGASITVLRASN